MAAKIQEAVASHWEYATTYIIYIYTIYFDIYVQIENTV